MSFVGSFNLLTVLKVVKISQCSGQSSAANFLGAVLFRPSCKLASIEHLCDLNYSKMRTNLPEMYWLESLTQSVYVCSASQTQVKCHVAHRRRLFYFSHLNSMTASDVAAAARTCQLTWWRAADLRYPSTKRSILGDSLHRFMENLKRWSAWPVGPAKFNFNQFTRVGTRPTKYQKFPLFLVKIRSAGQTPW